MSPAQSPVPASGSGLDAAAAAVQHALLARLLDDEAAGVPRSAADYQADFPGHEALVARLMSDLRAGEGAVHFEGRDRIGSYVLIRELGRGGQGVVFLARDARLPRFVALKVLSHAGLKLGAARLERFRREAHAASRLDHPAICGVLESGESDGVLYIAMRHVPGESLALHIAKAAATGDGASTRLQLPASDATGVPGTAHGGPQRGGSRGAARRECDRVLLLVERTARALHVAHEAGIVHRDVKPGNIMVTPDGDPVLLDFGLARDLDDGSPALTRTDEVFGTPAYMSPEQLRPGKLRVDRRADVYALGVTLFECLALRRPFRAVTPVDLADAIEKSPPPDPRAVDPTLPSDLSIVLATALARDAEHRYPTALDFADDLRRVRELEPIRARPAGALVRAWRWAQRNPGVAASLVVVFLSLSTGFAVSLLAYREADAQRAAALDSSEHRRDINEFMVWVLNSPDPLVMGADAPLRTMLERAESRVDEQFKGRPRTRAEVLQLLGKIQSGLGDSGAAAALFERSAETFRELEPGGVALARSLTLLANMYGGPGVDAARAEAAYGEALPILRDKVGPADHDLAEALRSRVRLLLDVNRADEARAMVAELAAAAGTGDDPALRRCWLHAQGLVDVHEARWTEAMADYRGALALPDDPGDPHAEWARNEDAEAMLNIALRLGDYGEAATWSGKTLEYMRRVLGENHPNVATAWSNHGTLLRMLGRHDEAEEPYKRALDISRKVLKAPNDDTAINLNNLGALYRYQGRRAEALELLSEAYEMLVALHGEQHPSVAGALDNIADLHLDAGEYAEALEAQLNSLDVLRHTYGDGHSETVNAFIRAAKIEVLAGKLDEARAHWELALPLTREVGAGGRVSLLRNVNQLALSLAEHGAADQGVILARETEAQLEQLEPDDRGKRIRFASDLAYCLHKAGALDEAAAWFATARGHLAAVKDPAQDVAATLAARVAAFTSETGRQIP